MIVTETIHHGDYRNVRTSGDVKTYAAFLTWLRQGPYGKTGATVSTNRYIRKLWVDLRFTGTGHHGWADYQKENTK